MHIPDGFIDTPVAAAAGAVAVAGIAVGIKKAADELDERRAPLAGLVAAFIFAMQMLNFPVAGGTSGHLLGGVLAAVLVGPWTGMLCISLVLLIQGLVFADGGLTALGLNIVNMGLIGAVGGYWVFRAIRGVLPSHQADRGRRIGDRRGHLGRPRVHRFLVRIRARREHERSSRDGVRRHGGNARLDRDRGRVDHGPHGGGGARGATRPGVRGAGSPPGAHRLADDHLGRGSMSADTSPTPDTTASKKMDRKNITLLIVGGLIVALGLAFFVSPYASSSPDGLEKVATDQGFIDSAEDAHASDGPLADYGVEGVDDEELSTGLAGIIGVAITFGVAMIALRVGSGRAGRTERGDHALVHDAVPTRTRSTSTGTAGSIGSHRSASSRRSSLFVLIVVSTPREAIWAFALYAVILIAVIRLAELPLGFVLKRLAIELPFVGFALLLPFIARGQQIEVLGLSVSLEGLWGAWNILVKGTLGVAASIVVASTTTMAELLKGLDRLHLPKAFTSIAMFMVRYLDVISDEMHRMKIARQSRGYDPRWIWEAKAVAHSAGALFIRSYERGERVYLAMLSRGYTGEMPSFGMLAATRQMWVIAMAVPALTARDLPVAWGLRP